MNIEQIQQDFATTAALCAGAGISISMFALNFGNLTSRLIREQRKPTAEEIARFTAMNAQMREQLNVQKRVVERTLKNTAD